MRPAQEAHLRGALASLIFTVFVIGVFIVATARDGTPIGIYDSGIGDHWQPDDRVLTVVDRTSDPTWHQSVLDAVDTWSKGGSDLRFSVVSAGGPCTQERDRIEVCEVSSAELANKGTEGEQGLFLPSVGHSHDYHSAILLVCGDCGVDQDRMIVITTHELGHALGLVHNPDPLSVMYYMGGTTQPDAFDYASLRARDGSAASP